MQGCDYLVGLGRFRVPGLGGLNRSHLALIASVQLARRLLINHLRAPNKGALKATAVTAPASATAMPMHGPTP